MRKQCAIPFLLLALLFTLNGLAFGQAANVPVCNGFNASGVPINTTTTSTNCTDYFGVGNYANSPLPAGTITGLSLLAGGSGYVNPVVVITDPGGSGATATAAATGGIVTGFTLIGGGTGYVIPQISIVDVGAGGSLAVPTCGAAPLTPCGSGAMAIATLGGPFSGGIRKFMDPLGDLTKAIAAADTATFPGSDYYEIALVQYAQKMHTDLPPTTLRGYVQIPSGSTACPVGVTPPYLGPVILAQKNKPVRVKFLNCLPGVAAGGNLFIPVDTTYMGAGVGPDGQPYLQNRATLHLHGGVTPWISDGTPHQWTVPVADWNNTTHQRGDSTQMVPDMFFVNGQVVPQCSATVTANCSGGTAAQLPVGATNDPGPGAMTFYWTNQQGARLMFYHDHAYGITRLNVYVGEAAGYLLYDPAEEAALAAATAPGNLLAGDLAHRVPLVIQDKTFVPSAGQVGVQDPTWALNFGRTPGTVNPGDLWFPHVYTTNQNPADPGGANGFGRWDYGAWFFPPQTSLTAAGSGPNGPNTAVTVPCTSAAFPGLILAPAAANNYLEGCPITPNPSGTPEGFMDTPVVNGVAYPVLHVAPEAYRFQILAAGNDRSWNLSWFVADATGKDVTMVPAAPPAAGSALPLCTAINSLTNPNLVMGLPTALLDGTGNPLNGTGLLGNCWPNYGPAPGIPQPQTMWAADGRVGGAPDPRTAGPAWVQIGTEGGLLPAPVVIPPTPVVYEGNTRSITITNVSAHGLWLGPAERADVIVDFSKFAGKTLILYNDAPTPAPAIDSRLDYFTGDGDQSPIGGAPNTQPGYGPNTRTVMQVVVDGTPTSTVPFSLPALQAAFATTPTAKGVFAATQPTIVVPEAIYNSAYNTTYANTYARISDNTMTFTPVTAITAAPCPNNAANCVNMDQKAIQELFTLDYGRMNATLGTELPLTNFLVQTTLPAGYVDWPTEIIQDGQTQIWKITHNGVDTHFIHFHLFNVQVINRMGWDGTVRPPEQNEVGWKDTVRMNPLEDIVVAVQPIKPTFPFPLPDSIHLMDVTMPAGSADMNMSGIDPATGNAIAGGVGQTNKMVNFGWEYVWHCHILGHEENDMMRPIIFQVAPPAPTSLVAAQAPATTNVTLTWIDNSSNEDSFTLQRSTTTAFASTDPGYASFAIDGSNSTGFSKLGYGGTLTFTDNTTTSGNTYYYRVQAVDSFTDKSPLSAPFQTVAMASTWSNIASASTVLIPPVVSFVGAPATAAFGTSFTVTATTNANAMPTITPVGVCTVGPVTGTPASAKAVVTMTSGTGSCALTASWLSVPPFLAASAAQTTTATLATPTVTFTGAPASSAYLSTFTLTATTNAAIAPTITTGNAAVCSAGAVSGTSPATSVITMNSGTGSCAMTASWAATLNYAAATLTQTTAAALATPVITWATPSPIPYGTALSATQLNASASFNGTPVAGVFTYTPAAGAVLNAGTQTLSVGFAPTLTTSFNSATATVALVVNRAALTITASSPSMIYGGPVPAITPIYTGLVNGNLAPATVPTCSTTATSASPASPPTYPSTCSGAADPNYTISYVAGRVTVNKATTSTTVSMLPNPSIRGQIVTVSFSVAPQFTGTPTGTVTVTASTGETCSAGLTAGAGSCPITFLTGGSRTLTASYPGNGNFQASSATATQVVSSVDLSSKSLLFGNQLVGTSSARQTVTLTNVGTTPLAMTSISIIGANFTQNNNCPLGGTLAAGRACSINVNFRPTVAGVLTATLSIVDGDVTSPQTVSLTGTGVQPAVSLSPTSLTFSAPRRTSQTHPVTLNNTGTAPLTIRGIFAGGRFSQTNNCGTSLAIGASCTINVTFSSNAAGTFTGTLSISDNAPGSPQTVTLTGTAQ
jgi:FtsP/CotA-like multicopper oxidase with cupredoxin domain